jgi:glycosyltransferase involved in cell wall biosynthesis
MTESTEQLAALEIPVKIVVNAVGYVGQSGGAGGAGVFIQYLIGELVRQHNVDVLIAPNSKSFHGRHGAARFIELPYVSAEILRHLREGPTVVIDPFGALPCAPFPEDLALCVVVHDLMHLERPHFFTKSERQDRSNCFARGLQRADAVVAFSADQARAIRLYFPGTAPIVVPHLPYGALTDLALTGPDSDVSAYEPFVLFPAVKWPHKNHRTVLAAFAAYIRNTGSKLRLILCGGPCAESRFSFYPPQEAICNQVVDLGLVSEVKLRALLEAASAVLFPTLYEGFGIPVLEAAYLGKMVIATRLDVFDEILGRHGYRAVDNPLCELRWMHAIAEVESAQRAKYESATQAIRNKVSQSRFISQFDEVLKGAAERYSHPGIFPVRAFRSGDRPTSSIAAALSFADIHSTASIERGSRNAALGIKASTQSSWIFRSAEADRDRRVLLRGRYNVGDETPDDGRSLLFSCWVRLLPGPKVDALRWSVNDTNIVDLLPELRDNEWHLVRQPIPSEGFIDFRGVRDGVSEAPGMDVELHDPCVIQVEAMPIPDEASLHRGLTIYVADIAGATTGLGSAIRAVRNVNEALPFAGPRLQWVIITSIGAAVGEIEGDLPGNVRIQTVDAETFTRASAASLVTPYQPIDQILLLEADDLSRCLEGENLAIIGAAVGAAASTVQILSLAPVGSGFWLDDEHGRILSVADRIGQPIPVLDREVIHACLNAKATPSRRQFAVIETDIVGNISHHSVVTKLFLDGAERCGFQPVLGLNRRARPAGQENIDFWTGFGEYVYSPGVADDFADELAAFVKAKKLGPDDLIFMHSLSPQIVLGAARFIAGHPATSPTISMRFFSTAEAMSGHKLSYRKILQSIESVEIVRQKMHFFCESENLISYYEETTGRRYPLLLNPEHPSLAAVRNSDWYDAAIGDRRHPTLAYFGEARAEKGFDYIPGIIEDLLADRTGPEFHFIVQTGSNSVNQTPEMKDARGTIRVLQKAYPDRIRCFESVDTPEQFYFLMKHASAVIAPYRPEAYGIRGTGVTLEALQMGLEVFAPVDTDLYATFCHTDRIVGVAKTETFAQAIARHYSQPVSEPGMSVAALRQTPEDVCRRLISLCIPSGPTRDLPPVLWLGNDTFGEGCSLVYAAQKLALRQIGCDYLELFVPWPDRNWRGGHRGVYDEMIYGFDSQYDCTGLAWVARPSFDAELTDILESVEKTGPTYSRLRALNAHMHVPESLRRAIQACQVRHTILNYAHLYPVISSIIQREHIVCETHDIISYAHAVRRGGPVSLTEKIDEFADLRLFPQIVAISADEQREMESACPASKVYWRLPPYIPEPPGKIRATQPPNAERWPGRFGIPDAIAQITPNMLAAHYTRPDLKQGFGLGSERGRAAFFRWWVFTGQFGPGMQLVLTPAQYQWLLDPVDGQYGKAGLTGLLQLILSWRPDLRAAFAAGETVDVAGLAAWAERNASRELGISRKDLLAMRERNAATRAMPAAKVASALPAVVRAGPTGIRGTVTEIEAQFQRIAEMETIDLVLVGSSHPANVESFKWFIDHVYLPHIAPTGRNLFVVGSACKQLASGMHRNIVLLGHCERIEPMLQVSRACPLPVIAGSGSPIKTIPALAVNGAVTVTERIEQAFRLSGCGIPSFAHPKAFAGDLNRLLTDDKWRQDRVQRARQYVIDVLKIEDYVDFWRKRIDAPPAKPKPSVADVPVAIDVPAQTKVEDPPSSTLEWASVLPINQRVKNRPRKR